MASLESRSEGNQLMRVEPLLLKPTTLPHGLGLADPGSLGAGERIDLKPIPKPIYSVTPIPSSIELVQSSSQTTPMQDVRNNNNSSWSAIFLISLRVSFYILVLTLTIGLTLAACKFTDIWDPCKFIYMNTTECTVNSYLKGMIYHTDCTETHTCILPGFDSVIHQRGWSIYTPNATTTGTTML